MKTIDKGLFAGLTGISLLTALAACSVQDGTASTSGTAALTRAVKIPTGPTCANGGAKVDFGVDTNSDGTLETSEVTGSAVVCNDAAAAASLVESVTLPTGDATCPTGGVEVKTGIDKNGNGVLDDGEFVATYLCNGAAGPVGATGAQGDAGATGANGSAGKTGATGATGAQGDAGETEAAGAQGDAGAAGHNSLITMTSEPAGANCGGGGIEIQSGLDANDDGVLDKDEVTSTGYVCNETSNCLDLTNTKDIDLTNNDWLDACVSAPGSHVVITAYDANGAIVYTATGTKVGSPWAQDAITDTGDLSSQYTPDNHDQKIQMTNGDWLVISAKNAANAGCQGDLGDGYGILVYGDPPSSYPSDIKLSVMSYGGFIYNGGDPRSFTNWSPDAELAWNGGKTMDSCEDGLTPFLGRVTFRVW